MKAAVYKGQQQFSIEEVATPSPGPGQVLVRVKYSAICGTDVHGFLYDVVPPGSVMGHEYCGAIAELGPDTSRWRVGDRVVGGGGVNPSGVERAARSEPRYNFRTMGYTAKALRAYAEYVVLEEWEPIPIPEGVPDETAALCEPCSVAVHAVRESKLRLGDAAVVLGAGPIGMFCLQVARAAGAGSVIVSEPAPARKDAALELGADAVIDPTEEDVIERVVELTGGRGPDVVFDCAGAGSTLDQAMSMVRRGGQVVLVALAWEPTSVLPVDWIAREINLRASFGALSHEWQIALELMKTGKVNVAPMVPSESYVPLDDIQEVFDSLRQPSTQRQMVVRP